MTEPIFRTGINTTTFAPAEAIIVAYSVSCNAFVEVQPSKLQTLTAMKKARRNRKSMK